MPQHFDKRPVSFTPSQMFSLVADIGRYPEFLPWCLDARVLGTKKDIVTADLVVGYKSLRETFTSTVKLQKPEKISVSYVAGPLSHLSNEWGFANMAGGGCELSFFVDFGFRSSLLGTMMDLFFDKAFRKMVGAFEDRAEKIYGKN